jgi:hypothetical protein
VNFKNNKNSTTFYKKTKWVFKERKVLKASVLPFETEVLAFLQLISTY